MRWHTVSRLLTLAVANCFAAVIVTVTGLSIWTAFHQTLRQLGPDTAVFAFLFVLLWVPAFLPVAWIGRRLLPSAPRLLYAIIVPIGLYATCIAALARLAVAWPLNGDGGDIAAFAVVIVCTSGMVINLFPDCRGASRD